MTGLRQVFRATGTSGRPATGFSGLVPSVATDEASVKPAPTASSRREHNLAQRRLAMRRAPVAQRPILWTPGAWRGAVMALPFGLVRTKSSIAGFCSAENILLAGFVQGSEKGPPIGESAISPDDAGAAEPAALPSGGLGHHGRTHPPRRLEDSIPPRHPRSQWRLPAFRLDQTAPIRLTQTSALY